MSGAISAEQAHYHRLVFFDNEHYLNNEFTTKEHIGCAKIGKDKKTEIGMDFFFLKDRQIMNERMIHVGLRNGMSIRSCCYQDRCIHRKQWKKQQMDEEYFFNHQLRNLTDDMKSYFAVCFRRKPLELDKSLENHKWHVKQASTQHDEHHYVMQPQSNTWTIPSNLHSASGNEQYLHVNDIVDSQNWSFCCVLGGTIIKIVKLKPNDPTSVTTNRELLQNSRQSSNVKGNFAGQSSKANPALYQNTQTRKCHELVGILLDELDSTDGEEFDHYDLMEEILDLSELSIEQVRKLPEEHLIYFENLLLKLGHEDLVAKYKKPIEGVYYRSDSPWDDHEKMEKPFIQTTGAANVITVQNCVIFIVDLYVLFTTPKEVKIQYGANGDKEAVFIRQKSDAYKDCVSPDDNILVVNDEELKESFQQECVNLTDENKIEEEIRIIDVVAEKLEKKIPLNESKYSWKNLPSTYQCAGYTRIQDENGGNLRCKNKRRYERGFPAWCHHHAIQEKLFNEFCVRNHQKGFIPSWWQELKNELKKINEEIDLAEELCNLTI